MQRRRDIIHSYIDTFSQHIGPSLQSHVFTDIDINYSHSPERSPPVPSSWAAPFDLYVVRVVTLTPDLEGRPLIDEEMQ